jgi:anti-anti-sigma regulatory factor
MQQVVVPASVTVRSVGAFVQDILVAVDSDKDVTLDLAQVIEVDLSFIQVVFAARERLARGNHSLSLVAPAPAAVTTLLDRAGFLTDPTPAETQFWFHGELPQ